MQQACHLERSNQAEAFGRGEITGPVHHSRTWARHLDFVPPRLAVGAGIRRVIAEQIIRTVIAHNSLEARRRLLRVDDGEPAALFSEIACGIVRTSGLIPRCGKRCRAAAPFEASAVPAICRIGIGVLGSRSNRRVKPSWIDRVDAYVGLHRELAARCRAVCKARDSASRRPTGANRAG